MGTVTEVFSTNGYGDSGALVNDREVVRGFIPISVTKIGIHDGCKVRIKRANCTSLIVEYV